jgi:ABC-type branched-subunit amino acid transport system substrate-binding protein
VAELRATGANTLMLFTSGPFAIEAVAHATRLAWKPQLYVADTASAPALMRRMPQATAQRAVSISFVKDPAAWAGDPGAALAGRIVTRYAPGAPRDRFVVAGMAAAYSLVDALKKAGKTPTRASLMRAVTHMNEASNPFLLPGMRVRTTPTTRFPISQVALQRWRNGRWARFGGLQPASP